MVLASVIVAVKFVSSFHVKHSSKASQGSSCVLIVTLTLTATRKKVTYVLSSVSCGLQYVGQTSNLRLRINNHRSCIVFPEVVFGFTNILHRIIIMGLLSLSSTVARLVTRMLVNSTGSLK